MAKKAISDLDPAAALDGTELIEGEQSGGSVQMTAANVARSIYKRYVALLSQTGTDAPTATVLENTLGGTVVWSYIDVGVYLATLAGVFVENKTHCVAGNNTSGFLLFGKSGDIPGADSILLQTTDGNGTATNAFLYQTAVEIRVYP